MAKQCLLCIGVMTGNSVDGADAVLTLFHPDGRIQDLCAHFLAFNDYLYTAIRALQTAVANASGVMQTVESDFKWLDPKGVTLGFTEVHDLYIHRVAQAVLELIDKAKVTATVLEQFPNFNATTVDLIGLHGQTCDHRPPSRVGGFIPEKVYTVQVGDGQLLADITGISVVYDFRSDDLMKGGEAAPLAPIHNEHLVGYAKVKGCFPVTFCNAGNTGNIAHVTHKVNQPDQLVTVGWDSGPFNHFPDLLMRVERRQSCDQDGQLGRTGKVQLSLLRTLFEESVSTIEGGNYFLQASPKSGDPNFYNSSLVLSQGAIAFEDRLRTVEYFSAYVYVHSLSATPDDIVLPRHFALFGGGWMNAVILEHFKGLLAGDFDRNPILPEHLDCFQSVLDRISDAGGLGFIGWARELGFDSKTMEARIFADMARCRLLEIPFSTPASTGVCEPTIAGIICVPEKKAKNSTKTVQSLLLKESVGFQVGCGLRWSRACGGWFGERERAV